MFGVLGQTHWYIGGIGVFDQVCLSSVASDQDTQDKSDQCGEAIKIDHQSFVRLLKVEYASQRFLGGDVLSGPEEAKSDDVNDRDEKLATFSEFERFEIEFLVDERDFLL